jgi:Dolichyl-phosphate-mannose-protein mannosyltransferase
MRLIARLLMDHARLTSLLSMSLIAMGFGIHLDRYPQFYVDEPFYNYPPIRYSHLGFYSYRHSVDTPHGDEIYCYNGPFNSRFQRLNFRVLGSGLASWRMPQFICGNLAILTLCWHLIRHGRVISGVVVPVVWAGDRSLMELLYGRPDGISLLFLVFAFLQLLNAARTGSPGRNWISGFCIGVACGFHFTAAPFVLAGFVALAISTPLRRLRSALGWYVLGGIVPLLAILVMWSPDLARSFEQLLWHVRLPMSSPYIDRFIELFRLLRWSRYWVMGLSLGWAACGNFAIRSTAQKSSQVDDEGQCYRKNYLWFCFLFGAAGAFAVFTPRALFPLYLIYFTCWPIVGVAFHFEDVYHAKGRSVGTIVLAVVLAIGWIPSLGWNLMRFRESIMFSSALQPKDMVERIQRVLRPGTVVCVDPVLVSAALDSGLDVDRLQWTQPMDRAQNGDALLLTEDEYKREAATRRDVFRGRPILFRGALFPDADQLRLPIIIFGTRSDP